MVRWIGVAFLLIGLLFSGVGAGVAWHQDRTIRAAIETRGVVLKRWIDVRTSSSSDGGTSTSYRPVVEYRYTVDGRTLQGDHVYPLSISAGRGWAERTIERFRDGETVAVYYRPERPDKTFLLRHYSFFPYLFLLFPQVFVGLGLAMALGAGASRAKPPTPVAGNDGWFALRPSRGIAARQRAAWIAAALWFGVGLAACGHYFSRAVAPYEPVALWTTAIYTALGLGVLGAGIYFFLLSRTIADAQVFLQSKTLRQGEEATVGVRQRLHAARHIPVARLGLVCLRAEKRTRGSKTTYTTETAYEQLDTVLSDHRGRAGEVIQLAHLLAVPTDTPATTPPGEKGYPRYRWCVRLRITIDGAPDYRADYPVIVTPAAGAADA